MTEKMTQEHQPRNLREYIKQCTPKIEFFRKIRRRLGVSITMVDKWCNLDAKTDNPEYLKVLSEETGIAEENLFKSFDDETN